MKREDWKIGKIKQVGDEFYICIESSDCPKCDLKGFHNCNIEFPCSTLSRKDGKEVIYKKLEKIGNPVNKKGKIYQCLDTTPKAGCIGCAFFNLQGCDKYFYIDNSICPNNEIWIEIKNKDMKEIDKVVINIDDRDYLLDRLEAILHDTHCQEYKDEICEAFSKYMVSETTFDLKPFDLNAAKAGKPVCTRDGRRARIICFDCKDETFQIVALVSGSLGREEIISYDKAGYSTTRDRDEMLMMLPEKKEGWVNVYKGGLLDTKSYNTRKEAFDKASPKDYVDTIKINWEE